MRIRGAKTEMEELGEDTDGMVDSTAKLRQEIMALSGVDIMLDKNTFKSTYQVMDELSQKWEDLSDIAQASIIELMAGKHQGNVFASLMENFDTARAALETAQNSAGSAMAEHAKWSESLEARLLKLQAAWQSLSQSFMSSDFLKVVLDGVITLVDVLDKLIDTFGTLPTLLGVFASIKGVINVFKAIKGGKEISGILGLLKTAFPNIGNGVQSAITGVQKLIASLKQLSLVTDGTGSALRGFFTLIKQHPYIAAATLAVTALTAAFVYQQKKAEEISKKVNELTSKYKEEHKALSDLEDDYDTSNESSMVSRYAELSKGVDNLGHNVSLTADEYSEYQGIVGSIASQIPSLVSGYNEQGNAILSCKDNVSELVAEYEKLIHIQNQEILTNTGVFEKDFKNVLNKESGEKLWSNGHGFWAGINNLFGGVGIFSEDYDLKADTVKRIEDI